jgi:hypothetical protein
MPTSAQNGENRDSDRFAELKVCFRPNKTSRTKTELHGKFRDEIYMDFYQDAEIA